MICTVAGLRLLVMGLMAGACVSLVSLGGVPALAERCEDLAKLKAPHATITGASVVRGGSFAPPSGAPLTGLPDFCRVSASVRPSDDSDIRVEVWMPLMGWNERIEGTGNGGFAGKISYGALGDGVRHGYAVANTDMGMATPDGKDASVFVNRPQRWTDWGSRATHEMTLLEKEIVRAYYRRDAKKSYFVGCSTGGEQALMEAQRFPDDYDGIVGGAAANNRTGVHLSILWNFVTTEKAPAAYLPEGKLALLSKAVLNACDALDGVKDGVIADPGKCHFDAALLQCWDADGEGCLTSDQVETVKSLYGGPVNPRTGESSYPGLPRGSEAGWSRLGPAPGAPVVVPYGPIFEWVFGLQWDWRSFDFDRQASMFTQALSGTLNATSPDLDTFRAHGHKLVTYHGWSDWLVAPEESIRYRDAVAARDRTVHGGSGSPVDDSFRLFMVPGMQHCGGGVGPNHFDALDAVVNWVERGVAPESMVAVEGVSVSGSKGAERLLCPYPKVAKYRGSGDRGAAANYACVDPMAGSR